MDEVQSPYPDVMEPPPPPVAKPPTLAGQIVAQVQADKSLAHLERVQDKLFIAVSAGAGALLLIAGELGYIIGRLH